MGKSYEHCVKICGRDITITDKRNILFSMAKKMNLVQEYYGGLFSVIGLQSRLMVEAFCALFGPAEGFSNMTVGQQMGALKQSNPELTHALDNVCNRVNTLGIGETHLNRVGMHAST